MNPLLPHEDIADAIAMAGLFASPFALVELWEAEQTAAFARWLEVGGTRYELDADECEPERLPTFVAQRERWARVNARVTV